MSNSNLQSNAFRTHVEQTMRYLSYRKIPATLRRRVRAYFALKWQRTRGFVEKGVIDELPRSIGMDVRRSSRVQYTCASRDHPRSLTPPHLSPRRLSHPASLTPRACCRCVWSCTRT